MYEQRGFAPPSLPLPIHAGLFFCFSTGIPICFPCALSSPSKERRLLWLATTCSRAGLNTPHGLPLWASTHNARSATCMHGSRRTWYNGLERIACCRESESFFTRLITRWWRRGVWIAMRLLGGMRGIDSLAWWFLSWPDDELKVLFLSLLVIFSIGIFHWNLCICYLAQALLYLFLNLIASGAFLIKLLV
jgi:hypothetical protein